MDDSPALSGDKLEAAHEQLRAMLPKCRNVVLFKGVPQLLRSIFDGEKAAEIESKFEEEGLLDCSMQELKKLTADNLEKLGLQKLGDRQRMLLRIERLTDL